MNGLRMCVCEACQWEGCKTVTHQVCPTRPLWISLFALFVPFNDTQARDGCFTETLETIIVPEPVDEFLFFKLEVMTGVHCESGAQGLVGVDAARTSHSCLFYVIKPNKSFSWWKSILDRIPSDFFSFLKPLQASCCLTAIAGC